MKTDVKTNDYGRFNFVGHAWWVSSLSVLVTVASIIYLMIGGINYGIDFRGGTEIQVRFAQGVTIDHLRGSLASLDLGEVGVQSFGDQDEFIIRFQGRAGKTDKETNEILNDSIAKVREVIEKQFASSGPEIRRVDTVGPQVGADLKRNSVLAVFYSLLVILIYIGLRFDYKYSPGAVLCLFHDAVVTLGIFVLSGREVNIPILAAILTLIGFSLNDTIVVFDRMRETEDIYREKGWAFIINKATNDMLGRTIITSGTTFISSVCLAIFADGTVADIAFAIAVGVLFGTYSSIYVAAPTILLLNKLQKGAKA
ncbi:MAG: protein translocase subunit SecF [Bdellovibrionaceae bacterium]|nr:protein translocase subunit SecF [Pseudobdellovibrionaceae bacterium]